MDDFIIISQKGNSDGFFDRQTKPLCFDDGPVSALTGENDGQNDPTPASALEQWKASSRSPDCVKAVAAIIIRNRNYVEQVGYHPDLEECIRKTLQNAEDSGDKSKASKCYEVLGALAAENGKVQEAVSLYQQTFDALLSMAEIDKSDLMGALNRFEKFWDSIGKPDEWRLMKLDILMRLSFKNKEFWEFRNLALKMYKIGGFKKSEEAYEKMIEEGFSPASNYCHLARLRITMDRFDEAEKAVEQAMAISQNCVPYVLARIHFFKVLFQFLKNSSARSELGELNSILETSKAHLTWEIDEMLGHVEESVSEKQYALLLALGNALQSASSMSDLKDNLIWRLSVASDREDWRYGNDRFRSFQGPSDLLEGGSDRG